MQDGTKEILAAIKANPGLFYVYILCRPSGEPFYIGCGQASLGRDRPRILDHERAARQGEKSLKSCIIRKIWRDGSSVIRAIDSWHNNPQSMFSRERELIAQFGRRDLGTGVLSNGNDGGTGQMNPSAEIRLTMSDAIKAAWTPERREQQRQRMLAQRNSPESSLLAAHKSSVELYWTPERRAEKSAEVQAAWQNAAYRDGLSAARRGSSAEGKERQKAAMKRLFADPAFKAEFVKSCVAYWTPERRAQQAERARQQQALGRRS